ncbi:MAG: carbon-nitrogen hydrolase family protein [Saprospiraceae bacterium]|nr:carbon-nitrogen hydrolase family protein [Saprospiraceae bacterium]
MTVKVCLVQDSPIFFNAKETLIKMEKIIVQNAKKRCDLIVFPESYIPGYPRGFSFGAVVGSRTEEGRKLYTEFHANSISLDGAEMNHLIQLSKTNNVYLCIGFTERQDQNGSLFCSTAYISPTDGLMGIHRKIKPTGTERLFWAEAGGESLVTFDTKIGKLGGLTCWENYMPLARMAMYKMGVEVYIAPTADSRDGWIQTMRHIAMEGRCFVLGCNQFFTKSMYPPHLRHMVQHEQEKFCRGGSVIVSPLGDIIAGPLYDTAGVLIAELNMDRIQESKLDFDVVGHYARNDIFQIDIKNQPKIYREK